MKIIQGASKNIILNIKKNGVVLDITGYTVKLAIKRKYGDSDASAILIRSNTVHNDPTNGVTTFILTPTQTNTLTLGTFIYEIEMSKDNELIVISKGDVTIDDKLID